MTSFLPLRHFFSMSIGVIKAVESDPGIVTAKNRRSKCALHIAILFENLDIIETLIRSNANAVHVQDNVRVCEIWFFMIN